METIQTRLCLCHAGLDGLSSDGTLQPCTIKQLFPVHRLRLVTLEENIFAWFPWLQRGEKWLASQPPDSLFIHTHIIYFCRIWEGLSCTESRSALQEIMCEFTLEHLFHPIISSGTGTIRELTKLRNIRSAQAGRKRLLHPYLLHGAQHDSHCGELTYTSLRSLFKPFSFHFLSSSRRPVEIPPQHLIKVYLLKTYQALFQGCFPSFYQNRE